MATTVRIWKVSFTQLIFTNSSIFCFKFTRTLNSLQFQRTQLKNYEVFGYKKKVKKKDYEKKIEVEHHMTSFQMNYNPSKLSQENMHVKELNGTFHNGYHFVRVHGIPKFLIFVHLKLKNFLSTLR